MKKKKKVGIVTFHFVNNFGGALQAYALWHVLSEKLQTRAKIVDYRNRFIQFTDFVRLFPVTTNRREMISGLKTMRARFGRLRKFHDFIAGHTTLTRRYRSEREIRSHLPDCDMYICGSDQIWNPVITLGVADAYFLGFANKGKVSYAPSFGTSSGNSRLKPSFEKKIQKHLKTFDRISVREKEGVELVGRLTGSEPARLIDPVFLLEKEEWSEIAAAPAIKEKYILLYIMQQDNDIYDYVRKLKEKLGLKLVAVSRYGYQPDYVDVCLVDVGPAEFLGLFHQADVICTNSFHGLAFSVIFEKECYLVPCKKFGSRIDNLAELLGISLDRADSMETPDALKVEKEKVRNKIAAERQKSIIYLTESVEMIS